MVEQFKEDSRAANLSRYSKAFMINEKHDRDFDKISQGKISKYFSNSNTHTCVPASYDTTKCVKKRILKKDKKAKTKKVFGKDIFLT